MMAVTQLLLFATFLVGAIAIQIDPESPYMKNKFDKLVNHFESLESDAARKRELESMLRNTLDGFSSEHSSPLRISGHFDRERSLQLSASNGGPKSSKAPKAPKKSKGSKSKSSKGDPSCSDLFVGNITECLVGLGPIFGTGCLLCYTVKVGISSTCESVAEDVCNNDDVCVPTCQICTPLMREAFSCAFEESSGECPPIMCPFPG